MSNDYDSIINVGMKNQEEVKAALDGLIRVARADAVFSEPVTSGEYTVITAAEIYAGAGLGYGLGGGSDSDPAKGDGDSSGGMGGGGGGGGASRGRPVAVISLGPDGVRVDPIVDPTKIVLALFTMLGSMLLMFGKMRKAGRWGG